MSVTISNQYRFETSSNSVIGCNQQQVSVSFFFRYEPGADVAASNGAFVLAREFYASTYVQLLGQGTTSGRVKMVLAVLNASSRAQQFLDLAKGVTYHIAYTYDQGSQVGYTNGVGSAFGSLSGPTFSSNRKFLIGGWDTTPGPNCAFTVSDVAIWHGYALTPQDVVGLRDGVQTPDQVGLSASAPFRWTLAGTPGATPAIGNIGLANAGDHSYDLVGTAGAGSAVYSAPLVWAPSAQIQDAYVAGSGKTLAVFFGNIATGGQAIGTSVAVAPTLYRNGVSVGQLGNPWVTGTHKCVLFSTPPGVTIAPTDSVAVSAPTAWANTDAGLAQGVSQRPVGNKVGRTLLGVESLPRAFRVGYNFSSQATMPDCPYSPMRNLALRLNPWPGSTVDAKGKVVTLQHTTDYALLMRLSNDNGLDSTSYPSARGLFAVGWDDLNTASPTTFGFTTNSGQTSTANTIIAERSDLYNPGTVSGGARRGIVRVFSVSPAPGSTTAVTDLALSITNANRTPQFENLAAYGPGDFSYRDGVPTVLDPPDPLEMPAIARDRLAHGAGSLRWMDCIAGIGGTSPYSEVSDVRYLDDFGWNGNRYAYNLGYTQARPYSQSASPYFYSPNFGDPYPCTLAAPVDASATVLTISDAATAPVMYGQRLMAGGETMRIVSVVGTAVTVVRGVEGTAAVPHAAGTLQVGYRIPSMDPDVMGLGTCYTFEFVTSQPHGIITGRSLKFSGTWPTFTFADGSTLSMPNTGCMAWVTGPNSFAGASYKAGGATATLSQTYTLDPAQQQSAVRTPGGPALPYEFVAAFTGDVEGADLYLNIPHGATDDLVDYIAAKVLANFPPGRTVWVEYSNEPWNYSFGQSRYLQPLARWLYPGTNDYAYIINRTDEVTRRFRAVFATAGRAAEVKNALNIQVVTPSVTAAALGYAAAQSPPIRIDSIAVAPYLNSKNTAVNIAAYNAYDVEQSVDLFAHDLIYDTSASSWPSWLAGHSQAIAAYNAATGFGCVLQGYEGGLELPVPSGVTNSVARNRDFVYSPQAYLCELDFLAFLQQYGLVRENVFSWTHAWFQTGSDWYVWGVYHWPYQDHGRGDGSDGKADNRLCLATPGLPNSKSALANQDLACVSVRGQAHLDWNAGFAPASQPVAARLHRGRARSRYGRFA